VRSRAESSSRGGRRESGDSLAYRCDASQIGACQPLPIQRQVRAGHGWPGDALSPAQEALLGPATEVTDIENEIWDFVSRFVGKL